MKYLIFLLFCILMILVSCESYDNYDKEKANIIVEGWIEDGEFPVVILTHSIPVSHSYVSTDSLSNYLIRWAKVTLYNGADSVVLTGKYDSGYFPPYIYTTSRMKGESGKNYQLTVEYMDYYATAETWIPPQPPVTQFRVTPCNDSDSLYQIIAQFKDYPHEKNYYQFFTRVGTDKKQFLASYLGSIDDAVLSGNSEVMVYRGHQLKSHDYTPYYHINDSVTVKFAQIDKKSYDFWDNYIKVLSLSGNMFLSTYMNVSSNIKGGFGYWCGYGAITKHIVIADSVSQSRKIFYENVTQMRNPY